MAKVAAVKIRVDEVTIGQTVRGNLGEGSHKVAEIKVDGLTARGGSQRRSLLFLNDKGVEFFVGAVAAKATILD